DERRREAERLIREIMVRQDAWPNKGHGDPVLTRLALVLVIYNPDGSRKAEVDALLVQVALHLSKNPRGRATAKLIERWAEANEPWDTGRREDAVQMEREILESARRLVGPDHLINCYILGDLAGKLAAMNQLKEADEAFRQALRIARRNFPNGHWLMAK